MENQQDNNNPSWFATLLLEGMLKANEVERDEPPLVWPEPVKLKRELKVVK
jgi:hypothetical protein